MTRGEMALGHDLAPRSVAVYDKPEETCNLESVKTCDFVTKLVPHLRGKEKCVGR